MVLCIAPKVQLVRSGNRELQVLFGNYCGVEAGAASRAWRRSRGPTAGGAGISQQGASAESLYKLNIMIENLLQGYL